MSEEEDREVEQREDQQVLREVQRLKSECGVVGEIQIMASVKQESREKEDSNSVLRSVGLTPMTKEINCPETAYYHRKRYDEQKNRHVSLVVFCVPVLIQ